MAKVLLDTDVFSYLTGKRPEVEALQADAWIAAIALEHRTPLATNNRKHFAGTPGLLLLPEPA